MIIYLAGEGQILDDEEDMIFNLGVYNRLLASNNMNRAEVVLGWVAERREEDEGD